MIFLSFFEEKHVTEQYAPDGMPRFAASHLGLFCLSMSHKTKEGQAEYISVKV